MKKNLSKCPSCGANISSKLTKCPFCGAEFYFQSSNSTLNENKFENKINASKPTSEISLPCKKVTKNYFTAKKVAYLGIMFALAFALLAVETYVFTLATPVPPSILTIPFAVSLCLAGRKSDMFIGGLFLGICSFILSFIIGVEAFMNPLISVFPRLFIGVSAYFTTLGMKKLCSKRTNKFVNEILPYAVGGAVGILTNTALVLPMLYIFSYTTIANIIATILSINTLCELISGIIIVPTIVPLINNLKERYIEK